MDTIPTTYKAYTYASRGAAADVLQVSEVATPPLAAQAVRIKVHSAALNATDFKYIEIPGVDMWFAASTPTQEQPHRIGFDVAGTVVQVGSGVHPTRLKVGDEVYGMTTFEYRGAVAEYVELDMSNVALKPKNLDFNHAAAVPVSALVSYQAMHVYTNVTQGSRVLILGGTTNTGMYALQFAKAVGAYVIVTASTKNEELLKSLGADEIIDYHTQNWREVVQAHSIDIAYDCGVER